MNSFEVVENALTLMRERAEKAEAALAAERSRVNEAERAAADVRFEREAMAELLHDAREEARQWESTARRAQSESASTLRLQNTDLRRDLETRDAEVTRLRVLLTDAAEAIEDSAVILRRLGYPKTEAMARGKAARYRAALATPKATTPAVPGDRPHLIGGEFQSDKYPTCPRGKVPLSTKDATAQDLLWEYAQRRRRVDVDFAADLETALRNSGYVPHSAPEGWAPPAVPGRLAEAEALLWEFPGLCPIHNAELDGGECSCAELLAWAERRLAARSSFLAPQPEPSASLQTDSPTVGSEFPADGLSTPPARSSKLGHRGQANSSPSPVRRESGDLPPAPRCGRCGQPTSPCHPGIGYVPGTEPSASLGESGGDAGILPSQHLPAEQKETGR